MSLLALARPAGGLCGVLLVGLSLLLALLIGASSGRRQTRAALGGGTTAVFSSAHAAVARILAGALGATGVGGAALELALLSLDRLEGDGRVEVGDVVEETHRGGGIE